MSDTHLMSKSMATVIHPHWLRGICRTKCIRVGRLTERVENKDNCRSTTGFLNFMAGGPIFWQSKLQTTVVTTSM